MSEHELEADPELAPLLDEWLLTSGRTATFQTFLASLETRAVRRARVKPDTAKKLPRANYASWR